MLARTLILFSLSVFASCSATGPDLDVDEESLRTVVAGWSEGGWNEIHSAMWNEDAGRWEDSSAESPWAEWDVEAVGSGVVEFRMSEGPRMRAALRDGVYRNLGPADAPQDPAQLIDAPIVAANVDSEQEWQLFMQWPTRPGESGDLLEFSELTRAGDLFTWSNWSGPSFDDKRRMTLSVNRLSRK